jgi:tRNA pseudouridine55 synthase
VFGFLNINKPPRMTSRDVVDVIQPFVRPDKIGHGGTLDPLATGVLVIGIGQATRLFQYLHQLPKAYRAEFQFGLKSDTLDSEGNVEEVPVSQVNANRTAFEAVLARWRGEIAQVPPAYSAVKVRGKRSYELARKGKDVELAPRAVVIHRLAVVDFAFPKVTLDIECSSGTYIRALGRDIAADLETSAVMTQLTRTSVGPFCLNDAIPLERVSAAAIPGYLLPPESALPMLPFVRLTRSQVDDVVAGRKLSIESLSAEQDAAAAFDEHGVLVAVLVPQGGRQWRADRCFRV